MRIRNAVSAAHIALASAGFASAASAQGLSRAEVRQQLVVAEADASRLVGNASWPDVSRTNQQQIAQAKPADGYGPALAASIAARSDFAQTARRTAQDN
ncbi:DUF4148 domain-containing protein [Paraburkholderia dinghuensis]|uniref:DUF4148 domain-containing protein n=1 Tax=Paraburkholderia dinghuensis TaxID=2305225 RepID=A0A3N6MYZ1_9BURK|nr:DUF4148 domain-containing protein [Paraburkholderia dinghuensis]RQH08999.1 DUF4148 domain-containing protein [Paraburkholderia dinghuensis]